MCQLSAASRRSSGNSGSASTPGSSSSPCFIASRASPPRSFALSTRSAWRRPGRPTSNGSAAAEEASARPFTVARKSYRGGRRQLAAEAAGPADGTAVTVSRPKAPSQLSWTPSTRPCGFRSAIQRSAASPSCSRCITCAISARSRCSALSWPPVISPAGDCCQRTATVLAGQRRPSDMPKPNSRASSATPCASRRPASRPDMSANTSASRSACGFRCTCRSATSSVATPARPSATSIQARKAPWACVNPAGSVK